MSLEKGKNSKIEKKVESLCEVCRHEYKICENKDLQRDLKEDIVRLTKRGYPRVFYCIYFSEIKKKGF